jgi:hypothetical protein
VRRGRAFWGLALVLLGALLLLGNLGMLTTPVSLIIWPSLLILLGVWALIGPVLGRAPLAESFSLPVGSARRGRIVLHHGAGVLTIQSGTRAGDLLAGTFGGGVEHRETALGDEVAVDLRLPWDLRHSGPWMWRSGHDLDWNVRLAEGLPLALRLETGAGKTVADLRGLNVRELHIETGASSTEVSLPAAAGTTTVDAHSGAASMTFTVPDGVAARVRTSGGLMGVNVDERRFPKRDGRWESDDFETAAHKADITIEMGAGSITVR